MATINDYKAWLQEVDIDPSDYESPSALVNAIRHVGEYGLFKVVEANGTMVLSFLLMVQKTNFT